MINTAVSIHPIWLIEENAKIFLINLWLNPPQTPINADKIIKIIINFHLNERKGKRETTRKKGATFCHERIINKLTHEHPTKI